MTLYSGLRPEEAQALGARLAAKNIPHQISPDGGSLLVPEDKLDASRLETAAAGLPRSARMGFELFDTPNWAGSDFTEKVNYQRALEGELERTLATLSEVEAVRVHLVMPQESLFTEQEHEAKAAVISEDPRRKAVGAGAAGDSATGGERGRPAASGKCDGGRRRQQHAAACMEETATGDGRSLQMKNWPRRWCIPWNRWWARITCEPACMWNMTWGRAKIRRKSTIRRPRQR